MYRVSFVGALTIASAAAAEPMAIDARTLGELVPGATVQLDTPLGTKLPVKYGSNGLMTGEAPALAFFLGSATDRGRWWIADDKLCHKWFKWFDAEVQCLQLRRDGAKIFWTRDDGKTGTATLVPPEPIVAAPYALGNPEPVREETAAQTGPPLAPANAGAPAAHGATAHTSAPVTSKPASAADKASVKAAAIARPNTAAATAPAKATGGPATKTASLVPIVPAIVSPPAKVTAPSATTGPPAKPGEGPSYNVIFRVSGVRADDVLNVRQGPSADAPAVGNIPSSGQGVRLLGRCQLEWCPVVHGGISGWVNSFYLVEDRKPLR